MLQCVIKHKSQYLVDQLTLQFDNVRLRDSNTSRMSHGSQRKRHNEKIIATYCMDAQEYICKLRESGIGRHLLQKWMDENYLRKAFVIALCGLKFTIFATWENEFPEILSDERPWNLQENPEETILELSEQLEYQLKMNDNLPESFQRNINDPRKLLDIVINNMGKLNI